MFANSLHVIGWRARKEKIYAYIHIVNSSNNIDFDDDDESTI